ncbi:hypothetical protein [Herbaspirillum sp. 1130]|uniref:hypothetical protein n=1 Tax=Herbaspirillum sp. 1130 TaxID=2806562 RepID=UPI001B6DA109|nr:hypothetical protein [Herbaspirillum sp. 1130]MBP1316330.1 hypothetical protein [Herbaspirillum sp. 1130]
MLIKCIDDFTRQFGAPADWDGKDMSCGVLPVLDVQTAEGNFMFSAWEPTPPELEALNKGANIILGVRGTVHPVVSVQVAADITPTEKHPDDIAVDQFAEAMKAKLADARAKGRSGWKECDPVELSHMLREHVEKGDPRDVANFCMFLWTLGKPIGDARPVIGLQLTPLDGIQVWIEAYTNANNGPHFMGHGRIVQLMREYLALRKLLAQRTLPPLPETHYNGSGDGSEPLYTADMLHLYASQYAASLALPVGRAPTDDQVKSAIRELDECEAFDDNGVTDEAVAIIRKMFASLPMADKLDAERLHWIDEQRSDFNHGVVLGLHFIKGKSGQQFHGKTLRAAIDAARAARCEPAEEGGKS